MTSFQNPLGFCMLPENKRHLLALLATHQVTLVEDDAYAEWYFDDQPPLPAKAYHLQEGVLHCCSFSTCLSAVFWGGWVAAGKHVEPI